MSTFLDKLRTTPSVTCTQWCWGVDPDLRTLGVGLVKATWTIPHTGPVVIEKATAATIMCDSPAKGLDQANRVVTDLPEILEMLSPPVREGWRAAVEAQRIYPLPDTPMKEVVAKANDLLRLAQVSGAAQLWLGAGARMVQPTDWKGQGDKDLTVYKISRTLGIQNVMLGVWKRDGKAYAPSESREVRADALKHLPAKYEHCMDALGLAIYCAQQISSGAWQ